MTVGTPTSFLLKKKQMRKSIKILQNLCCTLLLYWPSIWNFNYSFSLIAHRNFVPCAHCCSFLECYSLAFSLMCLLLHICISARGHYYRKLSDLPNPLPGSPPSSRRASYVCFSAHCSFRVLSAPGGWTVCPHLCIFCIRHRPGS